MNNIIKNVAIPATCFLFIALSFSALSTVYAADCPAIDHGHGAWNSLLKRWVSDGRVDYASLKQTSHQPLEDYLTTLSKTCATDYIKWSREERLAFWINAYNAFTVQLIVDNYPVKSIRKIGWLPGEAFRRKFIPMPGLKGADISLNNIENDTLRADFKEPRIHFALVCASASCPPLRSEAYQASQLDRQLNEQARLFLNDKTENYFDLATNTLYLSPIFDWFRADFEAVAESVVTYAAQYMDDPRIIKPGVKIKYTKYDWSLNDR